jgi:hypothetical protein
MLARRPRKKKAPRAAGLASADSRRNQNFMPHAIPREFWYILIVCVPPTGK